MGQDPTGFPGFHDREAPAGPSIEAAGTWAPAVRLTLQPTGGYRPQVAVGPDGTLHAVYYDRTDHGDIIRHRTSGDGVVWTPRVQVGFPDDRNWGPDLVARGDGSVVLVFDHTRGDLTSFGAVTTFRDGVWSTPVPLTPETGHEAGSGHIADATGADLAYVWIGKKSVPPPPTSGQRGPPPPPPGHFAAQWRWFDGERWSPAAAFSDGSQDAWHTNVERRPDGTVLAGWDVGPGSSATELYVADGRAGRFATPDHVSADAPKGERVHFAFGTDGVDHLTWFRRDDGMPVAVYTRSGHPGAWGATEEPSAGFGGFHFDPDIAITDAGVRCVVWGWDEGDRAALVYSLDIGGGWQQPRIVADLGAGKPGLPSLIADDRGFHVVWNQGTRDYTDVWYARLEL